MLNDYLIDTQIDIVLATMIVHNYIRKLITEDSTFQTAETEAYIHKNSTTTTNDTWIVRSDKIVAHIMQMLYFTLFFCF